MAKLVIQLGALDDLVSQLKGAAEGSMSSDKPEFDNGHMSYGKASKNAAPEMESDSEDNDEDDNQKYSEWYCEQCGAELKCTMPKQMMNCPCCEGAVMVKKS